ncbi:YbaB/EbfC family nucleoid-associated protein [Streptacidiphilus sp. EB129]|uniref:YbaB/EbfC family nucleoid-associated protein n=1 Tax=Streptacidiphilus sp. EB129 TaxID=3156262 RepID=UPI00351835BD
MDAEARLKELLDGYQRKRDGFMELQKQLGGTTATVRSRDRSVSVTVDARGQLTALKFESKDYQTMEPAELSEVILDTLGKARDKVRGEARQLMTPFLPQGTAFDELADGKLDWSKLLPEKPRTPEEIRKLLAPEEGS